MDEGVISLILISCTCMDDFHGTYQRSTSIGVVVASTVPESSHVSLDWLLIADAAPLLILLFLQCCIDSGGLDCFSKDHLFCAWCCVGIGVSLAYFRALL